MRAALDSGDQRSGARRTAYVDRGSDQASLPGVETPARFKGHDRRPPRLRRKTQTELEERVIPTPSLFLILVPNPSPIASPAAAACRRPQAGRGRQRFARKSLPGEGAASTFAIWPASPDKKRIAFGRAKS